MHNLGTTFDVSTDSATVVITEGTSVSFPTPPSVPPFSAITTTAETSSDANIDTSLATTTSSVALTTANAPVTTVITTAITTSVSTVELVVASKVRGDQRRSDERTVSNPLFGHYTVLITGSLGVVPVSGHVPLPTDGGQHDEPPADDPTDENHPAVNAETAAIDVSDSESDSKSNSSFRPSNFRGLTTGNAKEWLAYFEKYCTYKEYNEAKAMTLFKVLLVESAAVASRPLGQTFNPAGRARSGHVLLLSRLLP